jgi:hypothetical protein
MNDMTAVIIPKSDQINADDLIAGPITVTISEVAITAGTEQPVSIDIGIPGKVYRPCKSMSRVLVAAWGPDAKQYTGRSLTLYRDPTVKWGGLDVGGIRISHLSHIDKDMTMALTATRATRKPYTVRAMKDGPVTKPAKEGAGDGSKTDQWAALWRSRLQDPDVTAPRLSASWGSPQNNAARDKARRENAELEREVAQEVMDAITVLETA